ncbi:MAG: hypothetical protein MJ252_24735, partial [archaeon]|nr:hypothetical protein [archaeon]
MSKRSKKATGEPKISITQKDLDQMKVLADYTFFDEYQNKCSFPQFEKSLALFFKPDDLSLEEVFKELCGPKKKYLTFPRLLNAFNTYKTQKDSLRSDTRKFFSMLQNRILLQEEQELLKGKKVHYKAFTSTGNKNRNLLTKLTLVTDKDNLVKGMKMQYDDLIDANLFDQSEDVYFGNELEMGVLGEGVQSARDMKDLGDKSNCNTEFILRDSISHIFGTYTTKIELLGFKTRAGKTYFAGKPNGDGFLYGNPYRQFHYVKFKVGQGEEGMYNFQPFFISNPRYNECLQLQLEDVKPSLWENEPLINEEVALDKIDNPELLEKYIASAPIISDDVGAGDKVKEANELNNLAEIAPKEEKNYIAKEKDYDMINEAADALTANDILSSDPSKVRSGKRRGKSKSKAKEKKPKEDKNKKKKIKAKNVGKGEGNAKSMFNNKKNYKQLINKLNDDIEGDLENEKKKLKKKKDLQEKLKKTERARSEKKNPVNILAKAVQGSAEKGEDEERERESESEPKKLRAGGKRRNVTTTQKVSNGLGNYGSFANYQNPYGMAYSPYGQTQTYTVYSGYGNAFGPSYAYGPVSTNTGTKTTYYANYTPTQPQKQSTTSSLFDSVEDFFSSFGNNDSTNDVDDILNMNNEDLMKMFYTDNTPKQTTPTQPSSNVKPQQPKKDTKTKIKADPEADKRAQRNWIKFKDDMTNKKGLKILQGIGAVIRAMVALEQEERGDKNISLTEK